MGIDVAYADEEGGAALTDESGTAQHLPPHRLAHLDEGHSHLPLTAQASDSVGAAVMVHVLELGIVVHSISIGITLGLATGQDDALPLMIAICFHQFFEGIGLGSAFVNAGFSLARSCAFAALFAVTTPLELRSATGLKADSTLGQGPFCG